MTVAAISPDVRSTILALIVVAVGAFVSAVVKILVGRLDKKTDAIQVNVDGNLAKALARIEKLELERDEAAKPSG